MRPARCEFAKRGRGQRRAKREERESYPTLMQHKNWGLLISGSSPTFSSNHKASSRATSTRPPPAAVFTSFPDPPRWLKRLPASKCPECRGAWSGSGKAREEAAAKGRRGSQRQKRPQMETRAARQKRKVDRHFARRKRRKPLFPKLGALKRHRMDRIVMGRVNIVMVVQLVSAI